MVLPALIISSVTRPSFENGQKVNQSQAGQPPANTESLSFTLLAQQLQRLLAPKGQISLILPP